MREAEYWRHALLGLALTVVVALSGASDAVAQPGPIASARDEIRALAERHVEAGSPLKTDLALTLFGGKGSPLSDEEVARLYETEYNRLLDLKPDEPGGSRGFVADVKDYGWVVALLGVLMVVLMRAFGERLAAYWRSAENWLWTRVAGKRVFRSRALRIYRRRLADRTVSVSIPFRRGTPLDVRRLFVRPNVDGPVDVRAIVSANVPKPGSRIVLLGPPGAGKSIVLRTLAHRFSEMGGRTPIPVLLQLHRFSDLEVSPESELRHAFERDGFPRAARFVDAALDRGELLLLFDGFDEVSTPERWRVADMLTRFIERHPRCSVVITCRNAVYNGEFDELEAKQGTLRDFDDRQVLGFLRSWEDEFPQGKSSEMLMAALRENPKIMALARNPLMLTIIAHLYSSVEAYVLPRSRAAFYRESSDVLLNQWHRAHNLHDVVRKRHVLKHLALRSQSGDLDPEDRRAMRAEQAIAETRDVLRHLAVDESEAMSVLDEIVERSGLLLRLDGGEEYQFPHLTQQEYFAAEALINDPDRLLGLWVDDPAAWREVVKLYSGLAPDSTSAVKLVFENDPVTGLECLADAAQVDPGLAEKVLSHFVDQLGDPEQADLVERALGAVAADPGPRGRLVITRLAGILNGADSSSRAAAAARVLSLSNTPAAVQALAGAYVDVPEAGAALVRMGDIAVDSLRQLALFGHGEAVEDLVEVGTPRAVRVLAQLVDAGDEHMAVRAAWGLGDLLIDVRASAEWSFLSSVASTAADSEYAWVWRPFEGPMRGVNLLIPKISRLIASGDPVGPIRRMDPRIGVPLAFVDSHCLETRHREPVSPELVDAANALVGKQAFVVSDDGFKTTSPGLWRRRLGRGPLIMGGPHIGVSSGAGRGRTRGELLDLVLSMLLDAAASLPGDGVSRFHERMTRFVGLYAETRRCDSPRVDSLLGAMPPVPSLLALAALKEGPVSREDWQSRERDDAYFKARWHHVAALIGLAALSVAVAVQAASSGLPVWLVIAIEASLACGWVFMAKNAFEEITLVGVVVAVLAIPVVGHDLWVSRRRVKDRHLLSPLTGDTLLLLGSIGFTPSLVWFVARWVVTSPIRPIALGLVVVCGFLTAWSLASGARVRRDQNQALALLKRTAGTAAQSETHIQLDYVRGLVADSASSEADDVDGALVLSPPS